MQITVSGHQIEITESMRTYASEKVGRIQKHFDHVINANIVLHVQKNQHIAEATIHARGTTMHANAEGADMYAAIDSVAGKLDRQVLKHKEKTTHHRRGEGAIKKLRTL
ncbi:MAG: ribosome-associated translation inhibitor RaiA [Sulfuricaulis sp.]|jgi:putative sigma-54 modulation protein|uniref:ribosome hibernation-promoting factor, HPF/YfiA family n=1 Tax=Sulfuricaulis sp. TaxID=2003553 RepID=UPI0034A1F6AB